MAEEEGSDMEKWMKVQKGIGSSSIAEKWKNRWIMQQLITYLDIGKISGSTLLVDGKTPFARNSSQIKQFMQKLGDCDEKCDDRYFFQ